ncbi:MAG TPA: FHA domain-containing protein [Planctomycetota bacterium]|nr:FHA domain-containing protein [Planctomycetota bacterium]
MPRLIVTDSSHERREFPLTAGLTIGRQSGNHIQIEEAKASRTHCRVRPENGSFWLEDLNSSNGTKVNGNKVQRHLLKSGDLVVIGATTIVFEDENAPKPGPGESKRAKKEKPAEPEENEDGGLTVALSAVEVDRMDKKTLKKEASKKKIEKAEEKDPGASSSAAHALFHPSSALSPAPTQTAIDARRKALAAAKRNRLIGNVALVAVFVGVVWWVINNRDKFGATASQNTNTSSNNNGPVAPPPMKVENKVGDLVPPPVGPTKTDTGQKPPPEKQPEPDPTELQEQFRKILAERDKALSSNNFLGARSLLSQFAAKHTTGDVGTRAKQELKETEDLIETALRAALDDAKKAAADKKYRLATQRCTRLLSSDPHGKYGQEAKAMLDKLDTQSEPRYKDLDGQAEKELKAGNLDKAGELYGSIIKELGGTKWAGLASAEQIKVAMVRGLLKRLDDERMKRETAGEKIEVRIAKKWLKGTLAKVNGLVLEVKSGSGATLQFPIKTLDALEVEQILEGAGLASTHLEQAYLWMLLDKREAAQAQVEKALQDPVQSAEATRLAEMATKVKNLKGYDFSKWQHQMDWDALSGSWSTQDDRYMLESPEGGDTTLRKEALSGGLPAKGARISFDFELQNPGNGYFFALEFGEDDQRFAGLIFTSEGVTLTGNIKAAGSDKDAWTAGPTHVDVAINGDEMALLLNGKPSKTLKVEGLGEIKGTVTFRVRDTACAIDNVILRNVE